MKLFYALCGVAVLLLSSGCASRSHASRDLSGESFADETITENPIILQEEYEAEKGSPTYDIPVVRNAKVEQWITYFQGRGRKWFHVWLERSGRYIPFMRKILRDHDLPEDLVYLAMIESGFSPKAYSRARAVGPWQFIKSTGRLYGLKVDFWVDERRDPEKSTVAAARHLKDLYDQFQSWKLAAAAYNAGAGKVSKAIRRYRTEDFWELTKGRYLRAETKHYVPKIIAAALIAKEPEKYGFKDVQYQDSLQYDKIIIRDPVNLVFLAKKADVELDDLMAINPELNHPITPPGKQDYELRVPTRTSQTFMEAYNSLDSAERLQYTAHKVTKGDTLAKLARRYGVPSTEIANLNNLKSTRNLKTGSTLLIPVTNEAKWNVPAITKEAESTRPVIKRKLQNQWQDQENAENKVHVVRRGESLWTIAQRYGVTIQQIKLENRMKQNQIWPGKRLSIPQS